MTQASTIVTDRDQMANCDEMGCEEEWQGEGAHHQADAHCRATGHPVWISTIRKLEIDHELAAQGGGKRRKVAVL